MSDLGAEREAEIRGWLFGDSWPEELVVDELYNASRDLLTALDAARLEAGRGAGVSGPCTCKRFCCDTNDEIGVCKGLPGKPRPPLVEIILVHRDEKPAALAVKLGEQGHV